MSDIFEIKRKKIELQIGSSIFQIKDPKFVEKVMIQKEFKSLEKEKETLDEVDYLLKAYALNKKSIKLFIPELTDEVLDNDIPESSYPLLMKEIGNLAESHFGTTIEKSEKK